MTRFPSSTALAALAILGFGALAVGTAAPAVALPPASTCITSCTATFTSGGSGQTFTVPTGVTSLTATISGAAGAPAPIAITNDPTGVGGAGGSTTVTLGAADAGVTFGFGVGGTGEGSYLSTSGGTLLAVAGGGGGGGYVGRFDLPGQIFATYAGGAGGSPSGPGVAPGAAGTAFGNDPANGAGASAVGGAGGVGPAAGSAGASTHAIPLAQGGVGGTRPTTTYTGGNGGSGYAGGGGGAVTTVDGGDDITIDLVAAGGGGSGYLDPALTATAGTPNTGAGSVTFTWSFTPVVTTTAVSVVAGAAVPVIVSGLPANAPFSAMFDGATVATGVADAAGHASVTFTVAAAQRAGAFPVQLVVDSTTVASSSPVTVTAVAAATTDPPSNELADTGSTVTGWLLPVAGLLIVSGVALAFIRRRPSES